MNARRDLPHTARLVQQAEYGIVTAYGISEMLFAFASAAFTAIYPLLFMVSPPVSVFYGMVVVSGMQRAGITARSHPARPPRPRMRCSPVVQLELSDTEHQHEARQCADGFRAVRVPADQRTDDEQDEGSPCSRGLSFYFH